MFIEIFKLNRDDPCLVGCEMDKGLLTISKTVKMVDIP